MVEIYCVLSDSTAAELGSDISNKGGPAMTLYYARRDNREGELEWEEVSSDELTDDQPLTIGRT